MLKPGRKAEGPSDPVEEVIPVGKAGPFEFTAIESVGQDAVIELNTYLQSHGFPAQDATALTYFAENDFSFLCVRVAPPKGQPAFKQSLDLPPIVVGFETDEPFYPALFSASQGNFRLDLTLITDTPLKNIPLEYSRVRLGAERRSYVHLLNLWSVQTLPDVLQEPLSERASVQPELWYVNRIESFGFNEGDAAISSWDDDVFFKLGDYGDSVAGFWYYGDDDINPAEKFFREHALAIMVIASFVLFGGLYVKTRINRKRMLAERASS